jgi:hypothetical protein
MDLLDALCSNNHAPSEEQLQFLDLFAQVVPAPKQRHFFLMGQDCTSIGRPFAKNLEDRGILLPSWAHQPLHLYSEVNPLVNNWGKLRPFVLVFQSSKKGSLKKLCLK